MTWTLGVISVVAIVIGYLLPGWIIKWHKKRGLTIGNVSLYIPDTISAQILHSAQIPGTLMLHILRVAFFEAIAIFGLILGLMGASPEIALSFMAVSAVLLVYVFPTAKRWQKMLQS